MWIAGRLGHDLPGNRRKRRMLRYVAGQLTNIIQATAQDKAAQLRQAVRDGWKQYRAKGQASHDKQHAKTLTVYRWKCPGPQCKHRRNSYGESRNEVQERVTCLTCGTYFRTASCQRSEWGMEAYSDQCPHCHGIVQSSIRDGNVCVKHQSPQGKSCSKQFRVKNGARKEAL